MFGYIMVNKPELKVKEFDCYQSYYCGLCKELKRRHGFWGRLSLSYDMNFLVMLLTGLYEPGTEEACRGCVLHPFEKRRCSQNPYSAYAADMNVLLTYYKCMDDWRDERKITRAVYGKLLKKSMKRVKQKYPDKVLEIETALGELGTCEENREDDIDKMAGYSGRLLGTVFACQKDIWAEELYRMGFYLGKFIYLCDAYEDVYEDVKKGRYNPFHGIYQKEDFEAECGEMMTMMMAECCRAFERLPILENVEILRNILYSGVWCRYEMVRAKRTGGKDNTK